MLEVKELKHIEGYTLWLAFSDGSEGIVDLESSIWGPAFEPLKDINFFMKASLSPVLRTVIWPNDVDFAPEYLKEKMLDQRKLMWASEGSEEYQA